MRAEGNGASQRPASAGGSTAQGLGAGATDLDRGWSGHRVSPAAPPPQAAVSPRKRLAGRLAGRSDRAVRQRYNHPMDDAHRQAAEQVTALVRQAGGPSVMIMDGCHPDVTAGTFEGLVGGFS